MDVVIRPEDLYIFPVSEMAQLVGVVETSIFKGVHYEMTVLCGGYEFLVQDYHHFEVGAEVGLLVKPFDIHIMKKERVCNTFEGKLLDATHVEFLGCNFECVPVEGIAFDTNVKVEVDFEKVILQDNEEDGTLTGEVKFILYKGDHYHLTVLSDWDENVFVDTNDVRKIQVYFILGNSPDSTFFLIVSESLFNSLCTVSIILFTDSSLSI